VTPEEQALHVAAACGVTATTVESLYSPVASATRGVWRVGGAVVKVLQPVVAGGNWRADLDPDGPYYWRREADFYASSIPALVGAPEPYGVVDLPDGAVGVCVADASGAFVPSPWPLATYAAVATGVAALAGVTADEPWLSRDWLRAYVHRHEADAGYLADPPPLDGVAPADIETLTALWHRRDALLDALDRLPKALCHYDFSVQNVFPASDPPTVIDWAYPGYGAIGIDAGGLALESVLDFHLPVADISEVAAVTHDAYVAALPGIPEDDVRFGLCAGTAVKFAWIYPAVLRAVTQRPETLNKRPLDDALPIWTKALSHIAAMARTSPT
jgi:hypothetical protein